MTKILLATGHYYKELGGSYEAIGSTAYNLQKNGMQVKFINFFNGEAYKDINVKKVLENIDIVHYFGAWTWPHYFFTKKCFSLKKKIIITPMGTFEPWSLSQKKFKKKLALFFYQKSILKKADIIHCTSEDEENNIKKLDQKIKTLYIPHGSSGSTFKKSKISNPDNKKALFFSRIHFKKGLDLLLRAWSEAELKNWELHIYGPDGDGSIVNNKKFVNENNLSNKVFFKNPVYSYVEKKKLFEKFDMFLLPSRNENFGLSVAEALRHSLPVLTNENVPWKDIKKFNAGWYIDSQYNTLKKTLIDIDEISDENLLKKSINAYNLSKEYEWSKIIKRYIDMYNNLNKYN